jgi:hypothetical protein
MIMCDCQGIVKTLTKFIEDGVKPEHIKEHDLWEQIFHLADGLTTKQLCIQWMPSHLEEDKNAQKRELFLKKGIITQDDIEGNVAADKMAFKGADAHENITESIADMHDKLQFTVVVQKMLLSVWEDFIKDDGECNLADQQDLEEMERMMNVALFEAQMDDDYDPFEDDSNIAPRQKSPTDVAPEVMKPDMPKSDLEPKVETCLEDQCNFKRFPDYGWYHVNSAYDDAIKISTPDANDTNNLNKVVVMTVRTYELEQNGEKSHKTFTKYYIPMGWWEPMINWINSTRWSTFGLCDGKME